MSSASSRRSSRSGHFQLRRIVGEHFPAAESLVVAGLAVDGDAHVPLLAVFLARGRGQRRFERLEDDFLVDALLVRDGIDHQQDFFVHRFYLHGLSGHSGTESRPKILRIAIAPMPSTSISMPVAFACAAGPYSVGGHRAAPSIPPPLATTKRTKCAAVRSTRSSPGSTPPAGRRSEPDHGRRAARKSRG